MPRTPDPAWKKHGPPDPEPSASEHGFEMHYEPPHAMDIDGVGKSEAERIEGRPLAAVRAVWTCPRDGCDGRRRVYYLYDAEDVGEEAREVAQAATDYDWVEVFAEHATVVDFDGDEAYLGLQIADGPEYGSVSPCETIVAEPGDGPCYGHVEPDPEPHGL